MKKKRKPSGYWNYERCKEIALECKTKTELNKKNKSIYNAILINNWNELFDHMSITSNKNKRLIYVYEFDDNYCYVGLTCNINRRHNQHLGKEKYKGSSVYEHILKTNKLPKLIIKTDYINVNDAILLEEKFLIEYKNNGWIELNKTKTGGIGQNYKWNKELCREEAKKYNRIVDFMKNSGRAYFICIKNNWINEFFPKREISIKGYWNNKELCREESKKYKNRSEFCYGSWSAYNYSNINNWLDEFFTKN
jgi:predicted GIY-YIG superfamily endonuclease